MGVKSTFRQVPVDAVGGTDFAYIGRDSLVMDLRLHIGRKGSPGWFGLVESVREDQHRWTTEESVGLTAARIRTTVMNRLHRRQGSG